MIESRFSMKLSAVLLMTGLWFAGGASAQEPAATPEAGSVAAAGSAEAGATKAAVCTACHGLNGNSVNPEWPNLAGQNAAYLREQLAMFKAKKRNNPIMAPIIEPLTEQDFADLAAYFAAQTPAGLEADPSYWKAGETLYSAGDAARADSGLHGLPRSRGPGKFRLRLSRAARAAFRVHREAVAGLPHQNRYRDAADPTTVHETRNSAMMTTIAARLTPEDIRNLASYLQGLR